MMRVLYVPQLAKRYISCEVMLNSEEVKLVATSIVELCLAEASMSQNKTLLNRKLLKGLGLV